jgi:hypothetical protein
MTPLTNEQPAVEDIRNALTMAQMAHKGYVPAADRLAAFGDIARLLAHALMELERAKL